MDRKSEHVRGDQGTGSGKQSSIGELFAALTGDLSDLMRKEVHLAKIELREEATKARKAATMTGMAALAAYLAVLLLTFAAAWGLAEVVSIGYGFLIVGVFFALVAGFLFTAGRRRLQYIDPIPQQTVETLKEDVEWAKAQPK